MRDGLTVLGFLLLTFTGSAFLLASAFGYGEGWKVWAMPVTGAVLWLLAVRMVQVRVNRELRIRRARHRRSAWAGSMK
ncbi:hypothetical protein [Brevundimonas sp.]|uniref:hypothetical protein n=1 Tax=Brevundimonas sp. TaxID=1871086 RepID=UPI002EDB8946